MPAKTKTPVTGNSHVAELDQRDARIAELEQEIQRLRVREQKLSRTVASLVSSIRGLGAVADLFND
jgi:transposase